MEAVRGHLLQSRYYSNGVMNVGRGYGHGQGEAVLVDQNVDFYSFDFLSTVDAAFPAGRRRPARPAVRHEGDRDCRRTAPCGEDRSEGPSRDQSDSTARSRNTPS